MTRHASALAFLLFVPVGPGCSGGGEQNACADPSEVVVLPSPAWSAAGTLAPPAGDAAAAILDRHRPAWRVQLGEVDGWPSRPTVVVPLSGPAGSVDGAAVRVHADLGEGMVALPIAVAARLLEGGRSLLLVADEPLAPGVRDAVVALGPGAVSGARPLPACSPAGRPEPVYDEARASLGAGAADVALAVPIRLSEEPAVLGRLGRALERAPALEVVEVETRALDSFGGRSPSPEVAPLLRAAASGVLSLPDYRDGDGRFRLDAAGLPEPVGVTRPGFVVALPEAGTRPWPVVLFQHGGTQDKADFFALAGPLAAAGFAFVAIDLPSHGDRAAPGGGGDLDILDFEDPLRTRDNLRQAAADHLAVLTGLEELDAALEPALGISGSLDPGRVFYMGLSLGGITGSMTFAAAPRLLGAGLFVGGAGFPDLLSHGIFSLLVRDILEAPELERVVVLALLQTILEGADPAAYGRRGEDRSAPPRPALFFQAVGDPVVPAEASDRWARAFGADLALPAEHAVPGLADLPLPASDNFSWVPGGAAATRLLVQAPMVEVPVGARHAGLITEPYAQEMVAHCFLGVLERGTCEAVDTGFADR